MRGYDVGGAVVRRRINGGPEGLPMMPGDILSAEYVMGLSEGMRRVLVDQKTIEVFYLRQGTSDAGGIGGERHLLHLGGGRYHVVQGHLLTDEPVSRADAEKIVAGAKVPKDDEL